MKLTAELSLYPLLDDHITVIETFIETLREYADLDIVGNAMSTQVHGDHQQVVAAVSDTLAASHRRFGRQVLVAKFITGEFDLHS